jgi:hypothetical protein
MTIFQFSFDLNWEGYFCVDFQLSVIPIVSRYFFVISSHKNQVEFCCCVLKNRIIFVLQLWPVAPTKLINFQNLH